MPKERDIDLARLCRVMRAHRLTLQPFRETFKLFAREYAGEHYSGNAAEKTVPLNLLSKFVKVVSPKLVSKNPRFLFSTFVREMKPSVASLQTWANREVERMYLCDTLQRCVVDGLFSIGICKVALAAPQDAANGSWAYRAGTPFALPIHLDDWVWDMKARSHQECSYMGHRYRVPLASVQGDDNFARDRKKLAPSTNSAYNPGGDERIGRIGEGYIGTDEDFEDMVDLWEVYLPRDRLIVTLADDGDGPKTIDGESGLEGALRVQKWIGPPCGPYHFLIYNIVPGNIMPKGEIGDLFDTHDATNETYRKLVRQAGRQKENLAYGMGAAEDAERLRTAGDGDNVPVNHIDQMKIMRWGGPDQNNLGFGIHMKDIFSWMGGNLDILGGLSPQSKTAKQDAMLNSNSGATIADLQQTTLKFTASVGSALAWYWWHDPMKVIKTNHAVPGAEQFSINRVVTPQQRQQLPFEELNLKIDPYSLVYKTPEQIFAGLSGIMQNFVLPLAPILQPQGITPDMGRFLAIAAELLDEPRLPEIVTIQEPIMDSGISGGERPRLTPGSTERNYTRENISASESKDQGLAMMSPPSESGEAA